MPTQTHNTVRFRATVLTLALFLGMSATASWADSLTVSIDDTGEGTPIATYGGSGWSLVSSIINPTNPNGGFTDNLSLPGQKFNLIGVESITAHVNLIEKPNDGAGGQLGSGRISDQVTMVFSNDAAGLVLNLTFSTDTNENNTTTAIGLQENGTPQLLLDTISGDTQVNYFTGPSGVGFDFSPFQFKVVVRSDLDPAPEPSSLLLLASGAVVLLTWRRARRPE